MVNLSEKWSVYCQPIKTYICIPMEAVKVEHICVVSDDPA